MIKKLNRIVCPKQSVKYPITNLNPLDWLCSKTNTDYIVFDVDGYIIDSNKKPNGNFTRVEIISNNEDDLKSEDVVEKIIEYFEFKIKGNIKFSRVLNVGHWVIVTLNDFPKGYSKKIKGILSIVFEEKNSALKVVSKKLLTLDDMERGIKILRKFSFSKIKPLKSSPSQLSCYFNNETKNPFPGDLDGIIVNKKTNEIISLFEFKTHNINSPIENEYIGKYGNEDWRRFDVLFSLQNNILSKQGKKPSLYYIAWGTQNYENHSKIKIDKIENGKILKTKYIERPKFGEFSNELFNELI